MYVDGEGPFSEQSKGKYIGLELTEPLYLGGVANFNEISPEANGYAGGFVGNKFVSIYVIFFIINISIQVASVVSKSVMRSKTF